LKQFTYRWAGVDEAGMDRRTLKTPITGAARAAIPTASVRHSIPKTADTAGAPDCEGAFESKLDRRRGPGRRRTDYRRAAEEGHMNEEQLEFIKAIDEYRCVNDRPFPSWTEVLDLLLYLGYRKVAPVGEFALTKARQTPPRGPIDGEAS
jgi:hypothetical protein